MGYSRNYMLTQSDRENNVPLHLAVNSGDLEVEVGKFRNKHNFSVCSHLP